MTDWLEVPVCLDCGNLMLRALGHLYCPKCEIADALVVDLEHDEEGFTTAERIAQNRRKAAFFEV